jgi:hypothetical protein
MEMFKDADEMVEAICTEKDATKRKAAIKVLVGFATHAQDFMTSGVGDEGLAGEVTMSLLYIAIGNMGKSKKGGDK